MSIVIELLSHSLSVTREYLFSRKNLLVNLRYLNILCFTDIDCLRQCIFIRIPHIWQHTPIQCIDTSSTRFISFKRDQRLTPENGHSNHALYRESEIFSGLILYSKLSRASTLKPSRHISRYRLRSRLHARLVTVFYLSIVFSLCISARAFAKSSTIEICNLRSEISSYRSYHS